MTFFFQFIRIFSWWNYILPPVLSAVYFVVYITGIEFSESIPLILLWFISIVGTAIFGFAVNDIFDANLDKKAGKTNHLALLPKWKQWMIVLFSFFLASTPWFSLNLNSSALILLIFQLVLLVFYSTPPIRLKNNPYLSIISDSLYSGMIFIIAIILAGNLELESFKYPYIFFTITVNILFLRGLRNILIHQIADAENDQKSGITSFVLKLGKADTVKIINGILIAEIIGIIGFTILLSLQINFWLGLIIPGFISYFLLKRFDVKNKNKDKIYYIQILNDFYEDLLPLCFLVLLSLMNFQFLIVLIVHLTIFRNKIIFLLVEKILYGILYRKTCGLINRVLKTNF